MKQFNKRSVFSILLALMLVFTVGFYSSAEPTTAWFTASDFDKETYTMDVIQVDYGAAGTDTVDMSFKAATKFADADERSKMFEHACEFYTVTITNKSEDRAVLAFVNIVDSQTSEPLSSQKGVCYYIYKYDSETTYGETEVTELVPGVYQNAEGKRVLKDGNEYFRPNVMIAEVLDNVIGDNQQEIALLDDEGQNAFLNSQSSNLIRLEPGEEKQLCCAFWVEYDAFNAVKPGADGVRELNCSAKVIINAVQADHYPVGTTVDETN